MIDYDSLPPCNCDHDFYTGSGINFHFTGSCPKGDLLRDVERVIDGMSWATGSPLLTYGIYGGGFDDPWHWNWERYGGYSSHPRKWRQP